MVHESQGFKFPVETELKRGVGGNHINPNWLDDPCTNNEDVEVINLLGHKHDIFLAIVLVKLNFA